MVGHRPLEAGILVRVQVPEPRVNPFVGLRVLKILSPLHPLQGCRFPHAPVPLRGA